MTKKWSTRLSDVWDSINAMTGVPTDKKTAIRLYFDSLSDDQQKTLSEAMAQGSYTHSKPSITTWGDDRTAANNARTMEKMYRAYRRAMILILMAKRNTGNFQADLTAALAAVPDEVTGESEHRVKAELIDLNQSVIMMKAGGQVNNIDWTGWDGTKRRPLLAGCAIGRRGSQGPGTLGCFVTIGPDVFILSNRHVLEQASGGSFTDNTIIQPPHLLGGSYFDDVAEITEVARDLDAAIAKVKSGIICDNKTIAGTPRVITGSAVATANDVISKCGCATRERRGIITTLNSADVSTDASTTLTNQMLITLDADNDPTPDEIFQVKGDSGSIVLNSRNQVVALMHGQANQRVGQATHIGPILERFGAQVLVGTRTAP